MKQLWVLVGLVGLLCAPALQAAMVTPVNDTSNYSYGNGGEFRVLSSDLSWVLPNYVSSTSGTVGTTPYFQTFCIETSEYFSPGTAYSATMSDRAMYGRQNPGGDPISLGTAWLYSQFAAGTLSGYNYTYGGGRVASAGTLQEAIWYLEGEGGANNGFVTMAAAAVYNAGYGSDVFANANGAFNVLALNLGNPGSVQDQLVVVPEPTTMIAGALLLLPFGVSTLRILRKKYTA
jgi:hypothetical protein